MTAPLRSYQETVVRRALAQDRLAVWADPGLGKTRMVLETFRQLRSWCDVSSALVVAPLRVCYSVWPREAARWAPELRVRVLHGRDRRPDALRGADLYIINADLPALRWLEAQRWDWPEMLVVDESTRFKRISSQRSRALARLLPHFRRRYLLSGTPAPNGLENLHGQAFLLDGGAALFPTLEDFRERWSVCVPTGAQGYMRWRLRRGAADEIHRRVAPLSLRLDAKDHLDLPELVSSRIEVRLPPSARELYDRLRRDLVVQVERGHVVARNAGVLTSKCRQVANGCVYLTETGTVSAGGTRRSQTVHRAKVEALRDLVEDLQGQPLLVAFEYQHEKRLIQETLGPVVGRAPAIDGTVSGPEGARLERLWNAGELPVLLVQPQSGALGLNLQDGGHHLCFYSTPWDLEQYVQLIDRLLRQGQRAAHVLVYHLVAERTTDEVVLRALDRKDGEQRDFLDFLREDLAPGQAG